MAVTPGIASQLRVNPLESYKRVSFMSNRFDIDEDLSAWEWVEYAIAYRWNRPRKPYRVRIRFQNRLYELGCYFSIEQARHAREQAISRILELDQEPQFSYSDSPSLFD